MVKINEAQLYSTPPLIYEHLRKIWPASLVFYCTSTVRKTAIASLTQYT